MNLIFNPLRSGHDAIRNKLLWGSFWDTTIQMLEQANAAEVIGLNSSDPGNRGIGMTSGSRLTFSRGGVYSITYSIQFANPATHETDVCVWLRKNNQGSAGDLADTNTRFTVPHKHGSGDGYLTGAVNYVCKLAAADYLELVWCTNSTILKIDTLPAATEAPVHPRTPGIILTAVQVA
jgi:hypothetical protein